MVFLLNPLLMVLLFFACFIGPGFLISRKLSLEPLESLCVSIGLSFLLIYLGSYIIYCLKLPTQSYYFLSGIFIAATLYRGGEIFSMIFRSKILNSVTLYLAFIMWSLLLISMIRHFSGGMWGGDWIEHYERTLFFIQHLPLDIRFIGLWQLPARPPLMNLVAGFFIGQVGNDFYLFQLVFLMLNTTLILPCFLIAGIGGGSKRGYLFQLIAVILMLNPMIIQNVTYLWTKSFTSFFILLSVYFYVRSLRDNEIVKITLCFTFLSCGILSHYSAVPYAVFIMFHYLIFHIYKRRVSLKSLVIGLVPCVIILVSWFGWSAGVFGVQGTFFTNSTFLDSSNLSWVQNLLKIFRNIINTFIPHSFRDVSLEPIKQATFLGYFRDYLFLIYQTNFIVSFGLFNSIILAYIVIKHLTHERKYPEENLFWILFFICSCALGIAVHGAYDQYGLAHICLQPLVILGLIFLGVKIRKQSLFLRILMLTGVSVDFIAGIFIHFVLQNRVFTTDRVSAVLTVTNEENGLSLQAMMNWLSKESEGFIFFGDFFSPVSGCIKALTLIITLCILIYTGYRIIRNNNI